MNRRAFLFSIFAAPAVKLLVDRGPAVDDEVRRLLLLDSLTPEQRTFVEEIRKYRRHLAMWRSYVVAYGPGGS
jgi:hypothetical protein